MKPEYAILVVEDEDNDFLLLRRAFAQVNNSDDVSIHRARDGLEAMHYLQGKNEYADRDRYPYPEVLIVDLKMPRVSGLELLEWIRDHPEHRVIPTVIMSSSAQHTDVLKAYELGANTYFVKPSNFQDLVRLTQNVHAYWLQGIKPQR
jgi:CheY-like chemotaxis protein